MKLNAKVTTTERDKDRCLVFNADVKDGGWLFKLPNTDGYALDDELVLLVMTKERAQSVYEGVDRCIAGSSVAYGVDIADFLDSLRPDEPPPFEQCAVTCRNYVPKGCAEPHRCGLSAGHVGVHRFVSHDDRLTKAQIAVYFGRDATPAAEAMLDMPPTCPECKHDDPLDGKVCCTNTYMGQADNMDVIGRYCVCVCGHKCAPQPDTADMQEFRFEDGVNRAY